MKWIAGVLLVGAVFIAGAFYGIDKNNEKTKEEPVVVTTQPEPDPERRAGQKPEKEARIENSAENHCAPPYIEDEVPWISRLAGGVGEGIAVSFNGVIVVLSEMIQSGSS
ncbi:hypothetical protein [Halobacillus litoralis]|uniref:hypothetical protein n=1 Tax=Halobacillus litoralis TaxID=45668 RepID=UPI0024911FCD|nr:hypothetical protein [Halobacillus litoralis]